LANLKYSFALEFEEERMPERQGAGIRYQVSGIRYQVPVGRQAINTIEDKL
jgi:hypothetical protein